MPVAQHFMEYGEFQELPASTRVKLTQGLVFQTADVAEDRPLRTSARQLKPYWMDRSESIGLMADTALDVQDLGIEGVKLIKTRKFGDRRGFFSETYSQRDFSEAGINIDFVQDNQSMSSAVYTVRGLHFQLPPFAQDKLVRVIRGSILDVAVDLRSRSSTYGKYVSAVISADAWNQILVPIGFAHGFMTLEPDTEVIYKVSNYYSPEHDRGILWSDRDLAIDWPNRAEAHLSDKDEKLPAFRDLPKIF